MDPDMALAQIRSHIDGFKRAETKGEARRHADDLIEHFEALDEWLSREGFLPTPWQRATPQPPEIETGPAQCRHGITETADVTCVECATQTSCRDCGGETIDGAQCASCD